MRELYAVGVRTAVFSCRFVRTAGEMHLVSGGSLESVPSAVYICTSASLVLFGLYHKPGAFVSQSK
jgi:hypothetical protein